MQPRIERVDGVVPTDCPIDLIKIDVEGHEFAALSGAVETLDRWHPKIIFECLPETAPGSIESLLRGLGYSIFRLSSSGPVKIEGIASNRSTDHNYLASL
jgi:hypothetical protein